MKLWFGRKLKGLTYLQQGQRNAESIKVGITKLIDELDKLSYCEFRNKFNRN